MRLTLLVGISQAAASQPFAHKDAHLRYPIRPTRIARLMAGARQEQAWPLFLLENTQDGRVWRIHLCSNGTRAHRYPATGVRWTHQPEGENSTDFDQQSDSTWRLSYAYMTMTLTVLTDRADSKYCVSLINGRHCRCPHLASSPRHRSRWFLACHARQLDHFSLGIGIRPEIPTRTHLGAVLQHSGVLYWHLYQHSYQEEEACCAEEEG